MEKIVKYIVWFVVLLIVQVLFLNNISWFGLATPFLYIYLLLMVDRDMPRNSLMVLAFFFGLLIDIMSNTPGVNAGASVFLAFLRPQLIRLFSPRDEYENFAPGIKVMGMWPYLRYVLIAALLHHTILFLLEVFSFAHPGLLALRILCSTLLTTALIIPIELIRYHRS